MQNFDKFLAGCKASNRRKVLLLQERILLNPEYEGTRVLRNAGSRSPNRHPRRPEPATSQSLQLKYRISWTFYLFVNDPASTAEAKLRQRRCKDNNK